MSNRNFQDDTKTPIKNGLFQFGTYNKSFDNINLLEAKKPLGNFSPLFLKKFKLKEWQAFQIGNERFFILVAIYNAKFTGVVQFFIYDKIENKQYFYKIQPLPINLKVPDKLTNSVAEYKSSNFHIKAEYSAKGEIIVKASSNNLTKLPNFEAEFYADLNENTPQVVCVPFGENRGMYSQKSALKTKGKLKIGNENYEFKQENSFLILDDHKGYYPNPMIYDWCTGAKNDNNKLIAFNLTDNQSIDSEKFNENCIWIDKKIHLLPPVKFTRPEGVQKTWIIKDKNGMIDIEFTPTVKNEFILNFLVIKSDYYGPFGHFKGYIQPENSEKIIIDGYFGMGEQKYIRG
ncbi:MAG: DUF2804 domain-containing protein [Bacteroidales bacterium]|nr:DUF2804 domain-containing protein [Bacteroidales bacterium]